MARTTEKAHGVKERGRAMGKEGSVNAQNNRKALKNRNNRPGTAGKMEKRGESVAFGQYIII